MWVIPDAFSLKGSVAIVSEKKRKLDKFQVGSFLSYQVALTESHFEATASINCISRLDQVNNDVFNYPRFPVKDIDSMVIPEKLSEFENDQKLYNL